MDYEKEIGIYIDSYENTITDAMIKLYKKYGGFTRQNEKEVKEAHEIWLQFKKIRSEIDNIDWQLRDKVAETEEILQKLENAGMKILR